MDRSVIIALPIIAIFGFMGFKDGVVKRIIEVVGVVAALLLSARLASHANSWVMAQTGLGEGIALPATWAGLFLLGILLSRLLASLLTGLVNLSVLSWVNRVGGAVVGVFIGLLFASVLLQVISHLPGGDDVKASYQKTAFGRVIYFAAPSTYLVACRLADEHGDEVWDRFMDSTRQQADEAVNEAVNEAVGR